MTVGHGVGVLAPVLERVIDGFAGRIHLAKVEVDAGENMKLAGHDRVRGFPTVILFERGSGMRAFHRRAPRAFCAGVCEGALPDYFRLLEQAIR